eukprot:9852725-Karenia_brevis.AAC.1
MAYHEGEARACTLEVQMNGPVTMSIADGDEEPDPRAEEEIAHMYAFEQEKAGDAGLAYVLP